MQQVDSIYLSLGIVPIADWDTYMRTPDSLYQNY